MIITAGPPTRNSAAHSHGWDSRHAQQQTIESKQPGAEQAQRDAIGDALRAAYEEISRSHLAITDFRGKLLGLLPLATGVGIFLLLDNKAANTKPSLLAAAGVFGVLVTIGLFFYELRGVEECRLLRERGAELERKLLLPVGCSRFQGNMPGFIGPQGAGPIVYFAVIAGWLFVIVYAFTRSTTGWQMGLGGAIFVVYLVMLGVIFLIMNSSKKRDVETLRKVLEGFNRHNLDAIMSHFADDCVLESPSGPDRWGSRFAGKEQVRRGLAAHFQGIPDVHYGKDDHFTCGSRGVSEWTISGTTVGGDHIDVRGCDLWTFGHSKIVRKDSFWKIRDT